MIVPKLRQRGSAIGTIGTLCTHQKSYLISLSYQDPKPAGKTLPMGGWFQGPKRRHWKLPSLSVPLDFGTDAARVPSEGAMASARCLVRAARHDIIACSSFQKCYFKTFAKLLLLLLTLLLVMHRRVRC